ncbi:centrosome-associated protein Alms1a-like [Anastrepha ludens]|uniref:centrosome-associated protein Alms1a-like n=1 Tax=Anastrepha ludens TaxID=28586 RepID=UPI0023B0FFA2|nr:centrosome-associated protein Alms1a-like [Anastrepha ludens]
MRKGAHLPRTSRVNEKIIEYYLKFGQERDLEKYMRLYSPCEHHSDSRSRSTTTVSSCHSEDEGRVFRRMFNQDTESTTESDSETKEFIVPIEMQTEKISEKRMKPNECTSSAPDLHTPPPTSHKSAHTKQTQTPDSVAKSHRRLEWDSLGDVGYKKSKSTSNISILERSVLKEYFQEISCISGSKKGVNITDEGIRKPKQDKQQKTHKSEKSTEKQASIQSTPPLASSTMMDTKSCDNSAKTGSRHKLVCKSTSMSLQKRCDQYAQTSVQKVPQLTSKEVQVTLSSTASGTSSNAAGTATPSSFDYYSSRSAHSTTDGEVAVQKVLLHSEPKKCTKAKEQPKYVHPFIAGIHEMLASNKVYGSRKNSNSINAEATSLQQIHDTIKEVFSENKENTTASSSLLSSPQLDLGIQLLCSLIDARSLNQRQKKKLVRDIVKRISTLNIDTDNGKGITAPGSCVASTQSNASESRNACEQNMEATLKSASTVTIARTAKTSADMSGLGRDQASDTSSDEVGEKLVHVDVIKKPSPPTTSAKALEKLAKERTKDVQMQAKPVRVRAGSDDKNENVPKLTDIVANNINKNLDKSEKHKNPQTGEQFTLDNHSDKNSSASKTSTTTSKDITTQKALLNRESVGASDTDMDEIAHSTMREWLNPMTQSEIEYEEKKLEFARNAAKRDKIMKCLDTDKMDSERRTQLKWIQSEIERLETLRCLLSKSNREQSHEVESTHLEKNGTTAQKVDKLYDTVFSDQQSSSATTTAPSSGDKQPMQEIEVIIEESNEDVMELDEKLKRSKQRRRETQIVYDKPAEATNIYDNLVAGKARFRTMKETVTTNEEQILPPAADASNMPTPSASPPKQLSTAKPRQQQRSKIDTPSGDSNDGESVGSFAQQRKREFLEQYRIKKRIHYESLLHQQQQLLIQQQQQIIQELQQRCNVISHSTTNAPVGHYSMPHNTHNAYCRCVSDQRPYHQAYCQQQRNNMGRRQPQTNFTRPQHTQPHCPPCPPCPPRTQTHQSGAVNYAQKTQTIHSEQSTSSIFCISSEVSIPMGTTSTSSSTTTTTHQYDDVAAVGAGIAGVGIQTGASLRRTQPVFGRRLHYDYNQSMNARNWATYDPQPACSGQSISVQVKPKAIAYVIQFDKKTTTSTTTTINTVTSTSNTNSDSKPSDERNELRDDERQPCALQDYLERANPKFVAQTKERKAILNQIQALRLERERELRDIVENASENSLDTRLQRLPPPATKRLRIFATKEMKAMTQRHCKNLPEVVKQQERAREERRRHGNRLIRDIFNQRLQRRARTGKLSLNHSKTVI